MYIILKNKKNINIFSNIFIKYIIYLSFGDVLKWLRGHPAKVLDRSAMHGFESHRLRHFENSMNKSSYLMNKTKKVSERIVGIEILRYILMMLLIFEHLQEQCLPANPHGFLPIAPAITVPTFFMITGFYSRGTNRFYKFLNVFLSWIIFGFLFHEIFYLSGLIPVSPFQQFFEFQYIKDCIVSSWWFIFILFWVYLFGPYIDRFVEKYFKISFFILIFIFLILNYWTYTLFVYKKEFSQGLTDFISLYYLFRGFFYFFVGSIFKKIKINKFFKNFIGWTLILIYFIFLFGIKELYYDKEINSMLFWYDTTRNYFSIILILGSLGLIFVFSNISTKIKFINVVAYQLGKVSICIYLFHGFFFILFREFVPPWDPRKTGLTSESFTGLYFSILLCSTVFGYVILIPQKYLQKIITNLFNKFTNWYNKIN